MYFRFALIIAAVASIAGCASHPKDVYHAGDENPPAFLTGPVSVLLTNLDGFSARVNISGGEHPMTGDLLEREGRLIFQPDLGAKGKKARKANGMMFVWDTAQHSGFVLNDPLQGYAPISADYGASNIVFDTKAALEEQIDGKPCRRVEATIQSSDGQMARFLVWQDEDARHFPLRIQSASTVRPTTIEFSQLRLELPPPQLFGPPDGFTKYPTAVALMNDLIVRQTTVGIHEHTLDEDVNSAANLNNWRPAAPQ